jgi:hypothetical protein
MLQQAFDRATYMPVPNYYDSVSDVCLKITKGALKTSFFVVAIFGNSSGNGEEPTWVPNWLSGDLWQRKRRVEHLLLPQIKRNIRLDSCSCFPKWESHGNSVQDYSIKGKILRAKGRLVDTIHTLSSTFEEASLPSFTPNGCSTIMPARPSSDYDLFKALFVLLIFTPRSCRLHNRERNVEIKYFRLLFSRLKRTELRRLAPSVLAWLELNMSMDIFGRNLKRRISVPKGVRDCLEYLQPDVGLIEYIVAVRNKPYAWLLGRMQVVLKMGMRLATCDCGLGWTDPLARPGDQICVLQGCSVPVVLRAREAGGWNVVGDAIVFGAMNGQFMDAARCDYLDIY